MEYNNLHFAKGTPVKLIEELYNTYKSGHTTRIFYGDTETGLTNAEFHGTEGYLSVLKQSQSVLLLNTSIGVLNIDSSNIVRLDVNGVTVYVHPLFHVPTVEILPLADGRVTLKIEDRILASSISPVLAKQLLSH